MPASIEKQLHLSMIDMRSLISMKNTQIIIHILTILTLQLQQLQFITQNTMVQFMFQDDHHTADTNEHLTDDILQDTLMAIVHYTVVDIEEDMHATTNLVSLVMMLTNLTTPTIAQNSLKKFTLGVRNLCHYGEAMDRKRSAETAKSVIISGSRSVHQALL